MEIPAAASFTQPEKAGRLLKLSGRGFLYPGTWKKRFCVLHGNRFYYYEKENSRGSEKSSGVINLDYYDLCEEANGKDSKKGPNVFVIGTSDKTFFESGKYYFSADTLTEMNDWVRKIQRVIAKAKGKRRTPTKATGKLSVSTPTSPSISTAKSKQHDDLAKFVTLELPNTARLYSATKNRARGPKGRRLPQRKSLIPRSKLNYVDESSSPYIDNRMRANSLSALEMGSSVEGGENDHWMSRSIDLEDSQASGDNSNSQQDGLLCQFSSSDESLVHDELKKCHQGENSSGAGEDSHGGYLRSGGLSKPTRHQCLLKKEEEAAINMDHLKAQQLPVCRPECQAEYPCEPPPPMPCPPLPCPEPCGPEPCGPPPCDETQSSPSLLDLLNMAKDLPFDLSKINLSDNSALRSLIKSQCSQMGNIFQTLSMLKNNVGDFQKNAGDIESHLANVQNGMDGTSQRLEKINMQMQQLEQQMIVTLKDVHSMYDHAHHLVKEAERAKAEHLQLKHQCEETLERLMQSSGVFVPSESEDQSDT